MREYVLFKVEPQAHGGNDRVVSEIVAVRDSGEERFSLFAANSEGEPIGACLGYASLDLDTGKLEPSEGAPD